MECVKSSALSFFRRFYLNLNPIEFDPRSILFACIWVAIKVEDVNVKIDTFVASCKNDKCSVNNLHFNEVLVLRALKF